MTMHRRIILPLIATLAVGTALASQAPDFRSSYWYDSVDKVRAAERAQFVERRSEELNIAVSPPTPWRVEHLYFRDTLLGHSVLVLYRFDLECRQLYQADYIFPRVLGDQAVLKLVAAIEDKYKIKLETQYINDVLFSSGDISDSTAVNINQNGMLHFHNRNTTVSYRTRNWSWMGGWVEGKEPMCPGKKQRHERLKEKL